MKSNFIINPVNEFPNENIAENKVTNDENIIPNICNDCEEVFNSNDSLLDHCRSKHGGMTYSCSECEYKTGVKSSLKTHKQSTHEGAKYSCYECQHQASTQSNLKQHKESKHEGVVYSCNQCN